jgi:melibiose permease/lactose/raffinose/galactose permease
MEAAGATAEQLQEVINTVTGEPIWIMKIAMMILPLLCILAGFIIYNKKFKIDEKLYAQIVNDLEERNKQETE